MSRWMHFVLVAGMAMVTETGCSSGSRTARSVAATDEQVVAHLKPKTVNLLARAQAAVNEGHPADAERFVWLAEHSDRRSQSPRMTNVLRGELHLQAGRAAEVAAIARRILAENQRSCLGKELLGKALLQAGDWNEAERCFQDILQQPANEATKGRATDYLSVITGLKSYAEGEIKEANTCWNQISDPDIRAAVESALKRVRAERTGS